MTYQPQYDPTTKTWIGANSQYPYGKLGLGEVVLENFKKNLDYVCQISADTEEIYTNELILRKSISFANALKNFGIKKGDNVLVCMDNYHYMVPVWLGTIFSGAILCPFSITKSTHKSELMDIVQEINPKIMIVSQMELIDQFKNIFNELKMDCPMYIYENLIPGCHDLKPLLEENYDINSFTVSPIDDPASEVVTISFSSATTGKTKLIVNTHMQFLWMTVGLPENLIIGSTMVPGWISEALTIFYCLTSNSRRIILANYTIDTFLSAVEKYKVEILFMKPKDIFAALKSETIKHVDLSSVVIVGSSGEHLSVKVSDDFQKYIKEGIVTPIYGITETCTNISSPLFKAKPGSVGIITKDIEVRIVNEKGEKLGPNEIGEIYVKARANFLGYYKNEKQTEECFTSDGFFKTADIGYIDDEFFVFLVDRKKYAVTYGTVRINQSVVEKIIIEHVKCIDGVCVVDIEDDKHGNIICIAIIPEKGVRLNKDEIIKIVMKHHEFPFETKIFFFDELPMTMSGKYRKHIIRDMILKSME